MTDNTNYLYVNTNGDIWVTVGTPGGGAQPTVERYEGVPDDLIEELQESGWKLDDRMRDVLRELPFESM